jgi:hypothetical protein
VFLAAGDELVRAGDRVVDLVLEMDPRTATETLPEWESMLDLASTGTDSERQARIVAWLVGQLGFRPIDFQASLFGVLDLADPSDVVVIETSRALAIAVGDDREIFRFFIYRDPLVAGTPDLVEAERIMNNQKPSHTSGHIIESIDFLTDDPESLTNRDLLGV